MPAITQASGPLALNLVLVPDAAQREAMEVLYREFPRRARQLIADALNRTARNAATRFSRIITKETRGKLKRLSVLKRTTVKKANPATLTADVSLKSRGFPLLMLGARASRKKRQKPIHIFTNWGGKPGWRTVRKRGTGVTFTMGGITQSFPQAFVGTFKQGGKTRRGVFQRTGTDRQPIKFLRGPGLADILESSPELTPTVNIDISRELLKNLGSQYSRAIGEAAKGGVPMPRALAEKQERLAREALEAGGA